MEIRFKLDQWDILSELIFVVDETVFTESLAKEINEFWTGADERVKQCGSHIKAALQLYAVECFQQVAFNNMKDESWVMRQFDYTKGHGIEGFASFEQAGLVLYRIDPWGIEFEHVEVD